MVSIPACHAGDQGSIPCRGDFIPFATKSVQHETNMTKIESKGSQKGAKRQSKCIRKSMPEKGRQKGEHAMHFWDHFGSFWDGKIDEKQLVLIVVS